MVSVLKDNKYIFDYYRISLLSLKVKREGDRINLAKPSLILAVIEGIETGRIIDNQIRINIIKPIYCEILSAYQAEATPIRYPFYFLSNDGFWHIKWRISIKGNVHSPSEKYLRDNVEFASLDNALWDLLQDRGNREIFRQAVIDYYISEKEN